ncbi:pyridoxamine 5'-phosphate oxidase family protein [Nitriliruptor alkaliphilus]|uniref:pyridoxamine 5'-phosphate oxidase family protein n=1 Tax=Nitriliruptor alkaliphilus TaxID=427918 RepID=UPI000697DAA8|nr:pyridoxamine 5'-phosphate oxidase family protein [Nitriliruptor alkaliphilus]
MGAVYDRIDDDLRAWLARQPVLFVGSAPLDGDGHVNVSPKGMAGTFTVLDDHRVAYLDYTGSGTETIAHVRENGRLVLMWCAFEGPPRIVRIHGRGRVVLPGDGEFAELRGRFSKERTHGQRSIIVLEATRISDSCGFSVPEMTLVGDRDVLDRSHLRRDEAYFARYHRERNAVSLDGLPGLPSDQPVPLDG